MLCEGGLFVWQQGVEGDVKAAAYNGLTQVRWSQREVTYPSGGKETWYESVFQKGF